MGFQADAERVTPIDLAEFRIGDHVGHRRPSSPPAGSPPLSVMPRNDVVDDDPAILGGHLAHARNSASLYRNLIDLRADPVEMPVDALGVASRPKIPPARFKGPVCTALMSLRSNTRHRSSSRRVPRKVQPGLVIIDRGYAVNHTDDRPAASGFGLANGVCHTSATPENCPAICSALASMDLCSCQPM
jgi:hypothetical protein